AQTWSREWWPTQYNPAAQTSTNAPPPTYVAQVKESVQAGAGRYLALARRLGEEARAVGRGRGVGVVMVDPDAETGDGGSDPWVAVVAAAGDARYWEPEGAVLDQADITSDAKNGPDGHPEHHAMMRGIAMVSEKRLVLNKTPTPDDAAPQDQQQQQSSPQTRTPPLTPLETQFTKYAKPPSYLCTGLDAYISHEPCIMCSMGMLLSRFRSVTFPRTREGTPGVALDPHDGYGLHWRRELNWRAVAFRFDEVDGGDGGEGVVFNA
ncbi:tRNA-specific adenosine deaminase subunit tad3, partial [Ascosphaera atra]